MDKNKNTIKFYFGNIYKYRNINGNIEIAIYMCETNLSKNICIIPLKDSENSKLEFNIKGLNKKAFPNEAKEINKSNIISALMIKGKIAKVDYEEYVQLSTILLNKLANKVKITYDSLNQQRLNNVSKKDYALTEDYYKYITWFEHKTNIEFNRNIRRNPGIFKYGIYYAELGENVGSELHKLRPVLIYKKCVSKSNPNDSSFIVLPITSKMSSSKYSFNTVINVNGQKNWVKTNDIRRISLKRIVGPLYKSGTNYTIILSREEIKNVDDNFKKYFINEE